MGYDDDVEVHNKKLQGVIDNLESELKTSNDLLKTYIGFHFKCLIIFENINDNEELQEEWLDALNNEFKNKDLVERIIDPLEELPEVWEELWTGHHKFKDTLKELLEEEEKDV